MVQLPQHEILFQEKVCLHAHTLPFVKRVSARDSLQKDGHPCELSGRARISE